MARAEINKFRGNTTSSASASHKTSTGGDPNKLGKAGGKQRGGKISSNKRTTTRKRGK